MATVESRTRISIDELVENTVVSGYIATGGHLILVTRGGAEIDGGFIGDGPIGEHWSSTTPYAIGTAVGYAGMLWRASVANTNKPPALYTSVWTRLAGESASDWAERDPYFTGDSLSESWDTSWKTGLPVAALTSVAGEFESGRQALKLSLSADEVQSFYEKEENIVNGGETIYVTVRARLLSAVPTAKLRVELVQNDATDTPAPGSTGIVSTLADEGPVSLTTSWNTYVFTMYSVNGKPRANVLLSATTPGSAAAFLIDYVRITRGAGVGGGSGGTGPGVDIRVLPSPELFADTWSADISHFLDTDTPDVTVWDVATGLLTELDVRVTGNNTIQVKSGTHNAASAYQIRVTGRVSGGGGDGDDYEDEMVFAVSTTPWIFPHGQGHKNLNVWAEDAFGNELRGDVSFPDNNNARIDFFHGQTGKMRVFN